MAAGNTSGKISFIFCGSVSAPVEFSVGKLRFELSEAFLFFITLLLQLWEVLLQSSKMQKWEPGFLFQVLPWEWGFHRLIVFLLHCSKE